MSSLYLRFLFFVLYSLIKRSLSAIYDGNLIVEPVNLVAAPYAEWAHSHWVWFANPDESQSSLIGLVDDYRSHQIPVGAVNIDSAWPQKYQNFIWNSEKFPNPAQMIEHFHSIDVKVICWITSTINNDSTNYLEAKQNGFLLNDGKLIHWWRGHAGLLDYSNPSAVDWWHKQMDSLLNLGLDGWKCDGTDPYIWELVDAQGHKGHITEREYADTYYRDFFYYTRQKRGPDTLIMARPVDNFEKFLFVNYAPNDVMFSGWVGDQTGDWDGLKVALDNILHSAWRNYLNYGMDIGGYRTDGVNPMGREKNVFIRWFQLAAFLPLMENGGEGEHRPWMFGNDVTDLYRNFVTIHTNLAPYLLTAATECYQKNISVIRPMARKIPFGTPSTFDYKLYTDLFISPIVENVTNATFKLPDNSTVKWIYWFNSSVSFQGGQDVKNFNCSMNEYPAFIRAGSILPLRVNTNYSKFGTEHSNGFITLLIMSPQNGTHSVNVHEFNSSGYRVAYTYNKTLNQMEIFITAHPINKYIMLLKEVNSSPMIVSMRRTEKIFEKLDENSITDEFWTNVHSSMHKPTLNEVIIKINESSSRGIHLRLRNLN